MLYTLNKYDLLKNKITSSKKFFLIKLTLIMHFISLGSYIPYSKSILIITTMFKVVIVALVHHPYDAHQDYVPDK